MSKYKLVLLTSVCLITLLSCEHKKGKLQIAFTKKILFNASNVTIYRDSIFMYFDCADSQFYCYDLNRNKIILNARLLCDEDMALRYLAVADDLVVQSQVETTNFFKIKSNAIEKIGSINNVLPQDSNYYISCSDNLPLVYKSNLIFPLVLSGENDNNSIEDSIGYCIMNMGSFKIAPLKYVHPHILSSSANPLSSLFYSCINGDTLFTTYPFVDSVYAYSISNGRSYSYPLGLIDEKSYPALRLLLSDTFFNNLTPDDLALRQIGLSCHIYKIEFNPVSKHYFIAYKAIDSKPDYPYFPRLANMQWRYAEYLENWKKISDVKMPEKYDCFLPFDGEGRKMYIKKPDSLKSNLITITHE